jgi:general secretion pathway protein G
MKRSGFTMIELIFVIVILGILAAVAIPRLAATRDDAKIATKVQESTQALQEMSSYYTAHGFFGKVSDMTNVKLSTSATAETPADASEMNASATVYITDGNQVGCVSMATTATGAKEGNVTITTLSGVSPICTGVRKALNDKNISSTAGITHHFGGSNVVY